MEGERKQSWKFSGNELSTVTKQQLNLKCLFHTDSGEAEQIQTHPYKHSGNIYHCICQLSNMQVRTLLSRLSPTLLRSQGNSPLPHVQMQTIKMACVFRIHNWDNWFSFPCFLIPKILLQHQTDNSVKTQTPEKLARCKSTLATKTTVQQNRSLHIRSVLMVCVTLLCHILRIEMKSCFQNS